MSQITISLIIPAYNEEKYIAACLDHVVKHGIGPFLEIIVIDNASTDTTADIARQYNGVRVVHEEKKGLTCARQRGFLEARGSILAFADADTRMPARWAERVATEFGEDERLVSLSGPYVYYDLSMWRQYVVRLWWYLGYLPYLILGYMVVGGNFAIRKDIVEKMGGFDTTIAFYGEDTDIARRAHDFGKVKFSLSFIMPTSARRFRGDGFFMAGRTYILNFLSEVFLKKPVSAEYTDIR